MKVNSRIGLMIQEAGYRDDYIAKRVGLTSEKTVYNWRKGRSYPTFEKAFILAKVLGCKVDDLAEVEVDES